MRVALFKNLQSGMTSVWERPPWMPDYIQVSGWKEVEFPPLTDKERETAEELEALYRRHQAFERDFKRQRDEIQKARDALLKVGT